MTFKTNKIIVNQYKSFIRFIPIYLFWPVLGFIAVLYFFIIDAQLIFLFIVPLVLFVFFGLCAFISFMIYNHTISVEIDSTDIVVLKKRSSQCIFKIKYSKVYFIQTKGLYGLFFKDDLQKAVIWKHEFKKSDWLTIENIINGQLSSIGVLRDYIGLSFIKF